MTRSLTCEHRPRPAASIAVPRHAVLVLTVLVAYVSPPARPRRQADLQRGVHPLQAAKNTFVLRAPQAVADELQKLRGDCALAWTLIGIRTKPHVLSVRQRAPCLHAVVPVVRDRAQVARRDVLARVTGELRGDDERRDACREGRWRQTAGVLPAIELRQRTFSEEELRRRADHRRIRVVVEAFRDTEAPRQQDRKGDLVELCGLPVRRSVEEPVLKPPAVRALVELQMAKRA